MAVKIRLSRTGKTNRPYHRIGVYDQAAKRDGKAIENLGHYSPVDGDDKISIDVERLQYWVANGAQMSATVRSLLRRHGKLEALREAEGRRHFDRAKKAQDKAKAKLAAEAEAEAAAKAEAEAAASAEAEAAAEPQAEAAGEEKSEE